MLVLYVRCAQSAGSPLQSQCQAAKFDCDLGQGPLQETEIPLKFARQYDWQILLHDKLMLMLTQIYS